MKVIIIGSSIAGASAAFLLANYANVVVYEKKARKDIGKKICLNNTTSSFLNYCRKLGLNPKKYIISISEKAKIKSSNNIVVFKTKEFKINREKFLNDLIKKAEKKGAKFYFNVNFLDFKKNNKFKIILNVGNKKISDYSDILIGADGALSIVARKAGIKRKTYLVIQKEIQLKKLNLRLERNSYNVYVGKKFGYFSYIFVYKDKAVIGLADKLETASLRFKKFLKELRVDTKNISAAIVPEPNIFPNKKNLFLIGDAGGYTKFSGGGIVPAIMSAFAVKEVIVNNKFVKFLNLNKSILFNLIIFKILKKMNDRDFDCFIEIVKNRKFSDVLKRRDEFEVKDFIRLFDFRFLKFLPKLI
ncbi:MAG: NAD(P)/FAD-dependent oxidoreductase [Candidatus Pacearchaeota archaeon]